MKFRTACLKKLREENSFQIFEQFLNWIPNVGETLYVQLRVDVEHIDDGVVPDADDEDSDVEYGQAHQQGVKD